MDYHIFILTRVREAYDRGLTTAEAVEYGISATAGVVTSAALVMVGVFACFALMPILDMKEMGIGSRCPTPILVNLTSVSTRQHVVPTAAAAAGRTFGGDAPGRN
jgi:putative drug exporter of the RND superfamily